MTLEQLRYFQSAARLQHMGKAAIQENISQPSLSIAIKKLEKELGVPLFQPNGRGIELTTQGKALLPYADSILQQTQLARQQMNTCSEKFHGEIRVAYTASMAYGYIPRLFKNFLAHAGKSYLIYSDEMPSDDIAAGLKNGRFDLGICSEINAEPELVQLPLLYQPLVLLLPDTPDFATLNPKNLEDLCAFPFVSYRNDYPMYRQISTLFQAQGLTPRITHFAYSEDAIARLVEQGLGISIAARTESLSQYRIRILQPDWLKEGRTIYLTYHRLRICGEGVRKMMEFIKEQGK